MIKKFVDISLCFLITSCTVKYRDNNDSVFTYNRVPSYYTDEKEILSKTECKYDKFERKTECLSPEFKNTTNLDENIKANYADIGVKLRFTDDKDIKMNYRIIKVNNYIASQLYFVYSNSDWAFFREAYDETGIKLDFVEITGGEQVVWSRVREHFAINVNDEFIKKYEKTGVEIKFKGIHKNRIFKVQPEVLKAFKEQLKKVKSGKF